MSVEDQVELLSPADFVQSNHRLFIDTNIFMDTNRKWTGGLKRLFDQIGSDVLRNENPVVIPREVVGELRKFAERTRLSRVEPRWVSRTSIAFEMH